MNSLMTSAASTILRRHRCRRARLNVEVLEGRRLLNGGVPAGMDLGQANWFYQNVFSPPANVAPEWNGNVATGNAGTLGPDYLAAIVARINAYRWMAGLPGGVTLDPTENAEDQQDALMTAANDQLSHDPPSTWIDYTAAGADAAGHSDLALGVGGTSAIDLYMTDPGDNNTIVGHRRWILYPPTQTMGVGDIPGESDSLWVIQPQTTPVPAVTTVAWPPAGFVPAPLIPDRWSLQAPYGTDFSNATVAVTENGVSQQVDVLSNNGLDYGGQAIVWDMPGAPAPQPGQQVVYSVQVDNVVIDGQSQSFSYTTTSFDPSATTELTPVPAQVGFLQASAEVDATAGSITIDVARGMNDGQQVSVDFSTADGTAVAGTNYTSTSGVLTFGPGQYYSQIVVPILPGDSVHPGGTFSVTLSTPTGASVGPISSFSVTVDSAGPLTQPTPPVLAAADDSGTQGDGITNDATPAFHGTTEAGATVQLLSDTQVLGTTTADANGNYLVSVQSPLPVGTYQLTVIASYSSGSSPASEPLTLTIVAPPSTPSAPTLLPGDSIGSPSGETTFSTSPYLIGTTGPGASVLLLDASGTVTNTTQADSAGNYEIQVSGPLSVGSYSFRIEVVDQYGDVSTPSAPRTITVVAAPPLVTITNVQEKLNKKHRVTEVFVTFSGAVNARQADEAKGIYRLATPGKRGSYTARNAGIINLRSAVYTQATDTVALIPEKPFALTKPVQLEINGLAPSGLQDSYGRLIDGDDNGTAGGNAIVVLTKTGATIAR